MESYKDYLEGILNFDQERISELLGDLTRRKNVEHNRAINEAIDDNLREEKEELCDIGWKAFSDIEEAASIITSKIVNEKDLKVDAQSLLPRTGYNRILNDLVDRTLERYMNSYLEENLSSDFVLESDTIDGLRKYLNLHFLTRFSEVSPEELVPLNRRNLLYNKNNKNATQRTFIALWDRIRAGTISENMRDLIVLDLRFHISGQIQRHESPGILKRSRIEEAICRLIQDSIVEKTIERFHKNSGLSRKNFVTNLFEYCFMPHMHSGIAKGCPGDFEKEKMYAFISNQMYGRSDKVDEKTLLGYVKEFFEIKDGCVEYAKIEESCGFVCESYSKFLKKNLEGLAEEMRDLELDSEKFSGELVTWVDGHLEEIQELLSKSRELKSLNRQIENLQKIIGLVGREVHPSLNPTVSSCESNAETKHVDKKLEVLSIEQKTTSRSFS